MQDQTLPPLDKEGYLINLGDWNRVIAEQLAKAENISLSPAHWQIIDLLRAFYAQTDTSPTMRALVRLARQNLGTEQGSSVYLMGLFGGSPAKVAAKVAGLPRPTNCL